MDEQLLQTLQKMLSGNSPGSLNSILSQSNKTFKDSANFLNSAEKHTYDLSRGIKPELAQLPSMQSTSSGTDSIDTGIKKSLSSTGVDVISQVGGFAVDNSDSILQMLGGKKARDNNPAIGAVTKGIAKAGLNPQMLAATGGLSAIAAAPELLNQLDLYTGKTVAKQGTDGMDTSGYGLKTEELAGQKLRATESYNFGKVAKNALLKFTSVGGIARLFGAKLDKDTRSDKMKAIEARVKAADRQNLLAGRASYENKQNELSAQNSLNSVVGSNLNQLYQTNNSRILAAKKGGSINPATLRNIVKRAIRSLEGVTIEEEVFEPEVIEKFEQGGQIKNVIPSGALHAHKNNYEGDLKNAVTSKGIPVISHEEGGKMEQHAEIERDEIVFNKETTESILELYEKWKDSDDYDKYDIEIKAGELLTFEILQNTEDNTGLVNQIE